MVSPRSTLASTMVESSRWRASIRGIGRRPLVRESRGIPRADEGREVGVVEQERALGEQQPDRVLHRVDAADEVVRRTRSRARSTMSSGVVHGVNGRNDGRTSMPWVRRSCTACAASAAVCPLSRRVERRVVERLERRHHEEASRVGAARASRSACASTCSTLTVQSNVTSGDSARASRARSRMACCGAFRKSGSPKVMCWAPAATSWSMSASTAASSATRTRPS